MLKGISLATSGVVVLVAGTWLVCPDARCAPGRIDRAGLALADALRTPALDHGMAVATWLGSLALLLPLAAAATFLLVRRRALRAALFVPLALVSASALGHAVKLWVARPRPELHPAWVAMPADWSYPSAHAMQATALALAVFLLGKRGVGWAASLVAAVLVVGASRVYLQVHFPTDVLVGILAAGLWVAGIYAAMFPPDTRATQSARGRHEK